MNSIIIHLLNVCGGVVDWMGNHMIPCPSKKLFHFDCPGCGMQRSFLALLEGDLGKSLQLHPATIPLLFLVLFSMLHLKFDYKHGAQVIKWTQLGCAVIILIFYIYKVITHKIF